MKLFRQKKLLGIIGVTLLVLGVSAGITLVQQNQEYRERAQTNSIIYSNVCNPDQDCISAQLSTNPAEYRCPQTMTNTGAKTCNVAASQSGGVTDVIKCCCPNGLIVQNKNNNPNQPQCVEGTAVECNDRFRGRCVSNKAICTPPTNYGVVDCPSNEKCVPESANCTIPTPTGGGGGGGGGGGNKTPTPKPKSSGGGGGGGGGTTGCNGMKKNPSTFNISSDGGLDLYVKSSYKLSIALKKNATTCDTSTNDVVLDSSTAVEHKISTGLTVASGDTMCIFVAFEDGSLAKGWVEPNGGNCGRGGTPKDISDILELAPQALSVQCWNDPGGDKECDFNDFALLFAIGGGGVSGNGIKLRFQGITKKASDQLINASFIQSGSSIWSGQDINIANDENGVYTLNVDPAVLSGTYDLLVKGHSHLQKRFTNLVYNGNNQLVDLSSSETNQMRAGDVNDDNTISIEDVAQVSQYYTDFSVPVNTSDSKMVASDINKDGAITIQDLALIAINWSDFRVAGDK